MSTAISVDGIGKRYRIGTRQERADTLFGAALDVLRAPLRSFRDLRKLSAFGDGPADDVVWALQDVSFEVKHGEAVGLIGGNGAGKSTLLKVLARIVNPTTGSIDLHGRVASLLEVGTGFHPELTGRENAFLNGAILGMTKAEVERKFDEIVAFSGVEQYIDTPVKRYSSGMKVRLAFAVAAHLEPEILLVDEVLAVGDVAFQRKCLGKMEDVAGEGRTVIFVSHHMSMIQALCHRGVVLEAGRVAFDGSVGDSVQRYLKSSSLNSGALSPSERDGDGSIRVTGARLIGPDGDPVDYVVAGHSVTLEVDYATIRAVKKANVYLTIYNAYEVPVTTLDFRSVGFEASNLGRSGMFICKVPRLPLPPGGYRVTIQIAHQDGRADHINNALEFNVSSSVYFDNGYIPNKKYTSVLMDHDWDHVSSVA